MIAVHQDDTGHGGAGGEGARPAADAHSVALEWADLPEGVRTAAIAMAARTLSALPRDQVPSALAAVARFTPAKRARLGSVPLARMLQRDASFLALVAQHLPPDAAADPTHEAARAYVLRLPRRPEMLAAAERVDEVAALRRQVVELNDVVEHLSAQLAERSATGARDLSTKAPGGARLPRGGAGDGGPDEAQRLRKRLREQGTGSGRPNWPLANRPSAPPPSGRPRPRRRRANGPTPNRGGTVRSRRLGVSRRCR